jgi:hypothetical protein
MRRGISPRIVSSGKRMLRRSRDLFRWARERRVQSERFTEPSVFHGLSQRWDPIVRHVPLAAPPPLPYIPYKKTSVYLQKVRRRWTDLTR